MKKMCDPNGMDKMTKIATKTAKFFIMAKTIKQVKRVTHLKLMKQLELEVKSQKSV